MDIESGRTINAWIVCQSLGIPSEIWIDRQLERFTQIDPIILCWDIHSPKEAYANYDVTRLSTNIRPRSKSEKWIHRAKNLGGINFFAAPRKERDELKRIKARGSPDVILCHFGHIALRLLPFAIEHGIPIVAHFHGLDLSSALSNRWYRWSLKNCIRKFSHVIVVGHHQQDVVRDLGVSEQLIACIPCGVPVKVFQPSLRETSTGPVRFITVSRLVPWKGIEFCIKAFDQLLKQNIDAQLEIVGTGDSETELQHLCNTLGIAERVTFCGSLNASQVKEKLQQSDVFLQHSLNHTSGWVEGFGVSITEAAAMELPVIVSRCGGIVDQVEDAGTGYVVEQRDVSGLAQRMYELALDPEQRRRFGAAGRERAIAEFDTDVQVAKLEALLVDLVVKH